MSRVERSAGDFQAEAWTDSSPMHTKILYRGKLILTGLHPTELEDLEYIARRMREAIKEGSTQ